MKLFYFLIISFCVFSHGVKSQAPNWQWAKSAGGVGGEWGIDLSTDSLGNVFVTGWFDSPTITFGTIVLANSGMRDLFIVKYDAMGNVLWAKSVGGSGLEESTGISNDPTGNLIITGYFGSPAITFDTTVLYNAGVCDIFIVKYDPFGNVLWAKSEGSGFDDGGESIATDTEGNIFVTGYYQHNLMIDSIVLLNTDTFYFNLFVVKYNADGNMMWAKSAGGSSADRSSDISTDSKGNVLLTGFFYSPTITFGTYVLNNPDTLQSDLFIVKYDSYGNVIWAKSTGAIGQEYIYCIASDSDENVVIGGNFQSPAITFGGTFLTGFGLQDVFLAKYDSSGNELWASVAGGISYDVALGVACSADGDIYVSGAFMSPACTFGSFQLSTASQDIFVAKYDTSGNLIWIVNTGTGRSSSLVLDNSENIVITGTVGGAITFDSTTLTPAPGNGIDVFVAKMGNVTGLFHSENAGPEMHLYPNPGTGFFTLSSPDIIVKIIVRNAVGQTIYQTTPFEKQVLIQLDDAGIYFVQVAIGKGTFIKKIIVSN